MKIREYVNKKKLIAHRQRRSEPQQRPLTLTLSSPRESTACKYSSSALLGYKGKKDERSWSVRRMTTAHGAQRGIEEECSEVY